MSDSLPVTPTPTVLDALDRLADLAQTGEDERDDEVATLYGKIATALRAGASRG